ncbi:MAG: Lrp/AsnC family transcriptional regulator [Candidatus Woesearchaeota archaeon]|jgi:Lrp/AsnC family leucine-responsive transcriptional regulator
MTEVGIKYTKEHPLDTKDKKILSALYENGRYSIAEIAKKTGLRRDSIIYRIKKMQENQLIMGFQPVINPPALGYPNIAIMLLKTKSLSEALQTQFIKKTKSLPQIIHLAIVLGKFNYYLVAVYKEHQQLYQLLEQVKSFVPDQVLDYEILSVVEEPKYESFLDLINTYQKK